MTKAELLKKLEPLADDTEILAWCENPSGTMPSGVFPIRDALVEDSVNEAGDGREALHLVFDDVYGRADALAKIQQQRG